MCAVVFGLIKEAFQTLHQSRRVSFHYVLLYIHIVLHPSPTTDLVGILDREGSLGVPAVDAHVLDGKVVCDAHRHWRLRLRD